MIESLNSFLFSAPEMTSAFSTRAHLRSMMRFEWALTQALQRNGLADEGSAQIIESLLDCEFVNLEDLQREARNAGNVAIPFVRQLTAAVQKRSEAAARSIHLGATSQDVLDTALVLQMREALRLLDRSLMRLAEALTGQVRRHAATVLSGRTWLQPGPPTTLGLKLACIVDALRRDRERIHSAAQRALVLQFGGAVGTLGSLGSAGASVTSELGRILELRTPDLPWHTQRDRFVEIVQVLAMLTGTLAKFARDIALLMQVEVGEAAEGASEGRGGSSTMPHKRNPVSCAAVLAVHARMPGIAATMLQSMPQEHERGLGLWQAEWETVPIAFHLTSAALAYSLEIAEGLQVNEERMKANFDKLLGTTMSEAVTAALTAKMGRAAAHSLLRVLSNRASRENRHLADLLKESPEALAFVTPEDVDRLMDPREYLGSAQRFIEAVLGGADAVC